MDPITSLDHRVSSQFETKTAIITDIPRWIVWDLPKLFGHSSLDFIKESVCIRCAQKCMRMNIPYNLEDSPQLHKFILKCLFLHLQTQKCKNTRSFGFNPLYPFKISYTTTKFSTLHIYVLLIYSDYCWFVRGFFKKKHWTSLFF